MKNIERRFLKVEVRAEEKEDGMIIEGTPIVYDQETDIGWFREKIARGSATNALKTSDIFLLFNHDSNKPLARTKNGTLEAWEEEDGVHMRADLSKSTLGPDMYKDIKAGLIDKMSFAFTVEKQTWIEEEGKSDLRIVDEIKELFDLSPVTYPAYQQTELVARSAEGIAEEHKASTEVEDSEPSEPQADPVEALEPYELEINQILGEI